MADDMWFWIYLSLLPCYQRPVKGKRWGFDPLDCFSTPALLFFYQTQILIRINILFPGPPKDYFALCFKPLRQEERLPVWGEAFCLFEIYSLAGNCKMILAMILLMWCSSCCHCFGNTRVTYVFFKETTGCVGKKSVQIQIHVGVFESGDLHGFPTKMAIN